MRRYSLPLLAGLISICLVAAGCTPRPARTPTPPATAAATLYPSPTPGPSPTPRPATLTIAEPGAGETVVSPLVVRGQGTIPSSRTVAVQLLDAQGKALGQATLRFAQIGGAGELGVFYGLLTYQAPASSQPARLVAQTGGAGGPVLAQSQVALTVRGTGQEPAASLEVLEPQAAAQVSSPLAVRGQGVAAPQSTLQASLVDADGNLLGQGPLQFQPAAAAGRTASFSGTVEFATLAARTSGFLLVEQRQGQPATVVARAAVPLEILAPRGP